MIGPPGRIARCNWELKVGDCRFSPLTDEMFFSIKLSDIIEILLEIIEILLEIIEILLEI